jgi:hypothetical protein
MDRLKELHVKYNKIQIFIKAKGRILGHTTLISMMGVGF